MSDVLTDQDIDTFLVEHKLGVLATVNAEGNPDAVPIYFLRDPDYKMYFITPSETQKVTNIAAHPRVSLTVVDEADRSFVEIIGDAHEDADKITTIVDQMAERVNAQSEKVVDTLPLLRYEGQKKTVIRIDPISIRMRKYMDDTMLSHDLSVV